LLSAVFTKAIEWGAAEQNPCKQVPRLHEQKRERYIAETEFQSVRVLALPMMQTAMDLALLSGLRQGDLLRLEKRHLTDEGIDIVAERFTFYDIRAKSLSDDTAAAATVRSGRSDSR
jgi:integrase